MEFLKSIDELYYYLIIGTIFLIGRVIVARKNDLKLSLKYYLYSYGIVMLLFYISLPHVFPGHIDNISDVENKERLLQHLQRHNEALAKTTEIVRLMAFMTFLFISIIIDKVIKYVKIEELAE